MSKSGSESVSESASMSCYAWRRWGKPTAARCLLKTCPTSGVESSLTTRNDLCSRSWDRAWTSRSPGRRWREARRKRRRASSGRGATWPASKRAKAQEEGGRGGAGRGGCRKKITIHYQRCFTYTYYVSYTILKTISEASQMW